MWTNPLELHDTFKLCNLWVVNCVFKSLLFDIIIRSYYLVVNLSTETVSCSVVSDSAIPWTVACQEALPMEFSRQEYCSGFPFPSPGNLPTQGLNPGLPHCSQILYIWDTREVPTLVNGKIIISKAKEIIRFWNH